MSSELSPSAGVEGFIGAVRYLTEKGTSKCLESIMTENTNITLQCSRVNTAFEHNLEK